MEDKYAYVATFEEIKKNEFNLNTSRYMDTFDEEPEIDIAKMQNEMKKYLKELMNQHG